MKSTHRLLATLLATGAVAAATVPAQSAFAAEATAPAVSPAVDPAALQALERMSAYLGTLTTFRVVAQTTYDQVYDNGQTLTFDSTITYDVRRPDGFIINMAADRHVRQIYFDGQSITLFAPNRGLYGTVPAPATIDQTLDLAWQRYGILIPLRDLFRWSAPGGDRKLDLRTGVRVGYARIDGVDCDQYAFQEGGIDWQIWIARGAKPVPVRVVIIDATDLAHPQFSANLTWTETPAYAADAFTFKPPANSSRIGVEEVEQ
ncbi:MAG TPA: DUF2092 domain-containing protein [Caulobacter sp.]|nr:DUF2092 domain-containing protein [Caulobacter sp.]